jgi:hypothetical protein
MYWWFFWICLSNLGIVEEINSELHQKNLDAVFSVTSYNYDTESFIYSVMPKNSTDVSEQAQKIVSKHTSKTIADTRIGSFPIR